MRGKCCPGRTPAEALPERLAEWMLAEQLRFYGRKRAFPKEKADLRKRTMFIVKGAARSRTLRILERNGQPVAVVYRVPARQPRVRGQMGLSFFADPQAPRSMTTLWVQKELGDLARGSPRYTQIGFSAEEDRRFGATVMAAGFTVRYEVLTGETKKALAALVRKKRPARDLTHLGLALAPITTKAMLPEMMRLQKKVSLHSKRHAYFSNTPQQLRENRREYAEILRAGNGLLLGVYRKEKLVGLMIASVHRDPAAKGVSGGLSFFLDPSVQGLGIAKTGYLHMLEFFTKKKVNTFLGGTSQPAVRGLGKVMGRKVQHVLYVKM